SDEPRGPAGVATDFRGVRARRGRGGGPQRRELVGRRGVPPGGRRTRCAPELCPQTIEARLEGADLRRKRVHPTLLSGLLLTAGWPTRARRARPRRPGNVESCWKSPVPFF